ncbi:MAG: hypothetical protein ACTSVC_03845, partial [Promethearchaeota archaeon]
MSKGVNTLFNIAESNPNSFYFLLFKRISPFLIRIVQESSSGINSRINRTLFFFSKIFYLSAASKLVRDFSPKDAISVSLMNQLGVSSEDFDNEDRTSLSQIIPNITLSKYKEDDVISFIIEVINRAFSKLSDRLKLSLKSNLKKPILLRSIKLYELKSILFIIDKILDDIITPNYQSDDKPNNNTRKQQGNSPNSEPKSNLNPNDKEYIHDIDKSALNTTDLMIKKEAVVRDIDLLFRYGGIIGYLYKLLNLVVRRKLILEKKKIN